MLIFLEDNIIKNKEIHDYKKGGINVPQRPGLGVELDMPRVEKYARLHESMSAKQGIDVYFSEAVQSYPLW